MTVPVSHGVKFLPCGIPRCGPPLNDSTGLKGHLTGVYPACRSEADLSAGIVAEIPGTEAPPALLNLVELFIWGLLTSEFNLFYHRPTVNGQRITILSPGICVFFLIGCVILISVFRLLTSIIFPWVPCLS